MSKPDGYPIGTLVVLYAKRPDSCPERVGTVARITALPEVADLWYLSYPGLEERTFTAWAQDVEILYNPAKDYKEVNPHVTYAFPVNMMRPYREGVDYPPLEDINCSS